MIRFNNDYNRSAHPAVLEALMKSSGESYGGYGLDFWCEKAAEEIGKYIGTAEADIHFLVGGDAGQFYGDHSGSALLSERYQRGYGPYSGA